MINDMFTRPENFKSSELCDAIFELLEDYPSDEAEVERTHEFLRELRDRALRAEATKQPMS